MKIEAKLKKSQYIIVQYLLLFRGWSFYTLLILFFCILLAETARGNNILGVFIFLLVIILVLSIQIFWNVYSPKNKNFYLSYKWTIKEDTVYITTPISEEKYKWSMFVDYKKIPGFFILYMSSQFIYLFPKSIFSKEKYFEFVSMIQENIPKK